MGPDSEGKPKTMSGRSLEIRQDELEEIESYLMKMQVQMEDICASDLSSFSSSKTTDSQDSTPFHKPEAVRILATKQDNVKLLNDLALMKLRNLFPRQKVSGEDLSPNLGLERSSSLGSLQVPRLPGTLNARFGSSGLSDGADASLVGSQGLFDSIPSITEQMPPLKYIKTGDNTKAPFQKPPSIIFQPTPKLTVSLAPLDSATEPQPSSVTPSKSAPSPKKRRRDRNRNRNKIIVMPEPVLQKLTPGDTNKIPDDGHLWRKYGNKPIKTASFKRGYYKCRHFKDQKCMATKIVQPTNDDPGTFSVIYKGEHTCKYQANLGPSCGAEEGGEGPDADILADQADLEGPDEREHDKDDILDGMENWPENSGVSGSEDLFHADAGDDAVDSAMTTVEPPESPLLKAHEMTTSTDASHGFKPKLEPEETCPLDGQDPDFLDLDDGNQLLKMIGGGFWEDPSNINYWYNDVSDLLSPL